MWADRLENLAFNALPAAISDDMWTHQYDRQVNRIACIKFPSRSIFRTNNEEALLSVSTNYNHYELYGQSEWRYGLASTSFEVVEYKGDSVPFSSVNPRIALRAKLKPVLWDFAEGYETVAEKTPVSNKAIGEECEKELVPYGSAKLRITETVITE